MNEASQSGVPALPLLPPPLRFPLFTHALQSFRGTAWRLHTLTHMQLDGECDGLSVFGRSAANAQLRYLIKTTQRCLDKEPQLDSGF
ncbi:hypothetical protein DNTS_008039 [Danionella cerebrum]|uniref:Uncharacterized protein n=1 Tax=Danionella cerebrum TaxID=2873325 RepID=A0A553RGF6_9TELE|nr:hypothetical protein DNTS_008039 [Danionella translucida]